MRFRHFIQLLGPPYFRPYASLKLNLDNHYLPHGIALNIRVGNKFLTRSGTILLVTIGKKVVIKTPKKISLYSYKCRNHYGDLQVNIFSAHYFPILFQPTFSPQTKHCKPLVNLTAISRENFRTSYIAKVPAILTPPR